MPELTTNDSLPRLIVEGTVNAPAVPYYPLAADARISSTALLMRQLRREEIPAARCTVERLMKALALRGAVRPESHNPPSDIPGPIQISRTW